MTSGNFSSLPIDQVYVDRDERQRKRLDPAAIKSLADSIAKVGLIHPIVVERSGKLRVGETRLSACRTLGWTSIPVQFTDELDEPTLQLIELDENIKRSNLTWQEECDAISRYHSLRQAADPEWNQSRTAEALGINVRTISEHLAIKKQLEVPDSRVHKATKFSEARTIVARQASRKAESVLAELDNIPATVVNKVPLINDDFNRWALAYEGPQFNFIHCDFPYGINADNQQQGNNVAVLGGYEDSEDIYWNLIDTLETSMLNVIAPSAHLMFWFSMKFYQQTYERLTDMGWRVDPFPLIWHKSDNAGLLPDPNRGGRRVYETAFFASRGDRKIVQPISNLYSSPTTAKIHMSEKPLPVLEHFFRMFIDEYSAVLDPTCGSGNAARVAKRRGASSVLGIERSPEFFALATEHFHDDD